MSDILDRALLVKDVLDTYMVRELENQMSYLNPEANTEDGLIPNSYLDDDGVRHCVVWDTGLPERMRITKQDEDWVIVEKGIF